ncbi:hypothetical protein [Streptosporangium carneum]|uniref:Uncharacterized protein n=1 Tax=Streptosporangium carneum TaxID=47481 RepID=A0A9W6I461_9ACTN|nr:hypothetical protein [Streptosporangium carneum]GLK10639.1 hypothetical protein GCM10017600_40450 [Streptosporangium carneum]
MDESQEYTRYRQDAAVLAEIGRFLGPQVTRLTVRLSRDLAGTAIAAWERDEEGEVGRETPEQARVRDRAASLALIGLAVSDRGVASGDEVVVELDVTEVAAALLAAYDEDVIPLES